MGIVLQRGDGSERPGSCLTSLIRFTVIIPVFRWGMPGMCRSRTIPRGEFLWQGSCPDRDVVMVPVSAFHADPVYGIAHPVDMESNVPGAGGRAGFLPRLRIYSSSSLCLPFAYRAIYNFPDCHHYCCPGISWVFFWRVARDTVPGIAVIQEYDFGRANSRSSLLTLMASFREPSMPSCLMCVDPMLSLPLLSAGKQENFKTQV